MPYYDYECKKCSYAAEVKQAYEDKVLKRCPQCKGLSLVRLIGSPSFFVRGEATTIGQQAERNSARMGRAEVEEREAKAQEKQIKPNKKEKAPTPWWRNGSIPGLKRKDSILTPEECKQYESDLTALGCNVKTNAVPDKKDKK